jgi:hypothetical protein
MNDPLGDYAKAYINNKASGAFSEFMAYMEKKIMAGVGLPESFFDIKDGLHPIDQFNQMTAKGYKLNLITGEYYKP